jgi:PAS domain S-box-containing protein
MPNQGIILKGEYPPLTNIFRRFIMDIKSLAEQIGTGLGILGTVAVMVTKFNRRVVVPTRRWIDKMDETHKIISEQLQANGGSSLRDAILRIENQHLDHKAGFHSWMTLVTDGKLAMFEADHTGRCTWTNPIYKMWAGRMEEELAGDAWMGVIHPLDRDEVVCGWRDAVSQQRDFSGVYRMQDYNGALFWVKCLAVVKRSPQRTFGWLGRLERVPPPPDNLPIIS